MHTGFEERVLLKNGIFTKAGLHAVLEGGYFKAVDKIYLGSLKFIEQHTGRERKAPTTSECTRYSDNSSHVKKGMGRRRETKKTQADWTEG